MKPKVTVAPNPFTTELCLQVQGSFTANVVVRLVNSRGTVIRITACTFNKGENSITISNLQRYAAGRYRLEIKLQHGDVMEVINLTKKKVIV